MSLPRVTMHMTLAFPNASIIRLSRNEMDLFARNAFSTKFGKSPKLNDTCFETKYLAEMPRRYIPKNSIYVLAKNFVFDNRAMLRDACFSTNIASNSQDFLGIYF